MFKKQRLLPCSSLRSIPPRTAKSSRSAKEEQVDEPESIQKKEPIVEYMDGSMKALQTQVVEPSKVLFREIRSMRNHIALCNDLQENHPKLVEMVKKIDDEGWEMVENTRRVDRRFRTLQQKVTKKMAVVARPPAPHRNEKHCPQRGW